VSSHARVGVVLASGVRSSLSLKEPHGAIDIACWGGKATVGDRIRSPGCGQSSVEMRVKQAQSAKRGCAGVSCLDIPQLRLDLNYRLIEPAHRSFGDVWKNSSQSCLRTATNIANIIVLRWRQLEPSQCSQHGVVRSRPGGQSVEGRLGHTSDHSRQDNPEAWADDITRRVVRDGVGSRDCSVGARS